MLTNTQPSARRRLTDPCEANEIETTPSAAEHSWMQPLVETEYAIELLSKGYICVPLREGGKHLDLEAMEYHPLHLKARRKDLKELAFRSIAFQLSQKPPTPEEIRRWFRDFAGNVGIIGGYGNLLILDFDDSADYRAWSGKHAHLSSCTPVAKSPNGFHIYLRTREPAVSSSLYLGMRRIGHLKALGGYVVGSPSVLKDGCCYSWLKDQSPFDVEPQPVESLASLSLRAVSPFKHCYDGVLKRGFFVPQ